MTIVLNATTGITTPPVSVEGSTSGTITLVAPAVAGTNTQTLVAATGTLAPLILGTAQASTSGTSIDFTGIPSWVDRITVMFNNVSTNGTNIPIIQIGSGSFTTSGYAATSGYAVNGAPTTATAQTTGFPLTGAATAASAVTGIATLVLISGTTWVFSISGTQTGGTATFIGGGGVSSALSGVLDRIRITTVGGTDTFDAGSINILYE